MMYKNDTETMGPKSPVRWVIHTAIALSLCMTLLLIACSSDKTADKKTDENDQTDAANQRDTESVAAQQEEETQEEK